MNAGLRELLLEHDELAELDPARRRLGLRSLVGATEPKGAVGDAVAALADDVDGYGPVSRLLRDEEVTDLLINGPFEIWIDRAGVLELTDIVFESRRELQIWIERNLSRAGARADAGRPVADARLPDGSRMHVVLPPLAPAGPLVSIRRFPPRRFDLDALAAAGMLDERQAEILRSCVRDRVTVAISGATASGKTTLLNALLALVDPGERVVLIEEVPELSPVCRHFVSLVARSENVEGRGAVGLDALLRAALRMRPDRIVVGEVRGPEALVALGALSTGHKGSMVTVHSASASQVPERMVALALQASSGPGEASLRHQFEDSFGAIVHLERTREGRRAAEILRRA